ncbi:hypothetical protein J2W32_004779 [Variovorax boronicumulans]|uniref:MarR family transcriptional regulator n=1 Tax=Variovorax boronicumulans TaxID=436515 RepID=A0AAW8CVW0_9BURK|nr:hypothetical protein [Variovorax boronicumulans]MDP9895573.1 hypothetical protein [Variovorax boronicumulans]MDQ0055719.1 hypothetical protein [Variovorax boronicumulans]
MPMTTPAAFAAPPRTRRPLLSYSVDGLPARDELLFKSLVRLLDHRTHQQWTWQVEDADLRVVGDRVPATALDDAADRPVPRLTLGETPPPHGPFLRLPLHADALEVMLNRLGAMVVHARELGLPGSALTPAARDHSERGRGAHCEEYRLLRWPAAALLDTPMRMKLAALLASRPASLHALQQRSSAGAQECADFIAALEHAGFVAGTGHGHGNAGTGFAASHAPESLWPDSQSFQVSGASSGADAHRALAPARAVVAPGLLARIRNRLGLLPSGSKA